MNEELSGAPRYRPSICAAPFREGSDGTEVEPLSRSEQDALLAVSQLVSVRRHTVLYLAQAGGLRIEACVAVVRSSATAGMHER
ncbi:hypothetical protein G3N58_18555 [Paraburkholderia sp. Ac-20342]|uniref:hypothetical protein n=1 Tax=Paraburkholderia sp. Ac-20342 TaxID=2703889 RepID=UPI00197FC4DE|nr:hypothetical protein [Paraburkholderia sp. Ac-20342]MBN3848812.1 hypothetical protein [Paraburkholderia sp. Ac-20342]